MLPVLTGNTISWGGVVETFSTVSEASTYYQQAINNVNSQATTATTLVQDLSKLPILISVSPTSFALPAVGGAVAFTTSLITIRGYGFSYATLNKLYLEDVTTNTLDSNGYYLTCVYVSPTLLIATTGNTGDGVMPAGNVAIYYQDSNGVQSNVIPATTDGTGGAAGYPIITI
jgi:hypothetical protein